MTIEPGYEHLLRVDAGGAIRIGKSRVTLIVLLTQYELGDGPEGIAEAFPTVTAQQAKKVIEYYHNHKSELDAYLAEAERKAEYWRQLSYEQDPGFRERLLARRAQQQQKS